MMVKFAFLTFLVDKKGCKTLQNVAGNIFMILFRYEKLRTTQNP